jgi:hypothetical protein
MRNPDLMQPDLMRQKIVPTLHLCGMLFGSHEATLRKRSTFKSTK